MATEERFERIENILQQLGEADGEARAADSRLDARIGKVAELTYAIGESILARDAQIDRLVQVAQPQQE